MFPDGKAAGNGSKQDISSNMLYVYIEHMRNDMITILYSVHMDCAIN